MTLRSQPDVTPTVILLVLCAAVLHATWNAVLRSGADRLWSLTVMTVASSIAALPVALLLPLPAAASWPYILLSAALHVGYNLFLVRAYRHGELGQVYPIARGSSPLMVTLGAAIFAGEQLSPLALAGVALVSLGIISLSRGKGSARPMSIMTALATGGFIACYTVTDGIGARL
jgi:drug/metabolite transporter (DMT)-like permease